MNESVSQGRSAGTLKSEGFKDFIFWAGLFIMCDDAIKIRTKSCREGNTLFC